MRASRPRYPRPQDIATYKLALGQAIPVDAPLQMGYRESAKLVPNWRFQGITKGIQWVADVYCGGFCYVAVGRFNEQVRSLPAAIRFIRTQLAMRGVL
jgi:hypothetical protein